MHFTYYPIVTGRSAHITVIDYYAEFTYVPSADAYYKVILEAVDWDTAVQRCQLFGPYSHLATLTTYVKAVATRDYLINITSSRKN